MDFPKYLKGAGGSTSSPMMLLLVMVFFPGLWIKELIIKIVKRQYHMQMKSKKSHVVAF